MTEKKDLTRRDFFSYTFMGSSLFASLTLLTYYMLQYLFPSENKNLTRKVYITTTDKIASGKSIKFKDLKGSNITITNTGNEYIALSTKCTHLGCQVFWRKDDKVFYCPCHEGFFNSDGEVVKGPPPKPLDTYKVEVIGKAIYIHVDEVFRGSA